MGYFTCIAVFVRMVRICTRKQIAVHAYNLFSIKAVTVARMTV